MSAQTRTKKLTAPGMMECLTKICLEFVMESQKGILVDGL